MAFVYFIENTENNSIKIGYTGKNVKSRLSQLQTGSSARLKVIKVINGNLPLETALHRKFSEYRLNGEWFSKEIKSKLDEINIEDYKTVNTNDENINIKKLPDSIKMFPGITERIYFQNSETKEFWFHATSVCNVLGYKNVTTALALHCDDDEKFLKIWNGKAAWFVSEAGCYGLAMGGKNEIAKTFKRKLKHDIIP